MSLKRFFIACACTASLLGIGAVPLVASAQEIASGLQEIGQVVKLPSTDPRVIVARVINVALSLIGIILVVLLIYAGFLYMTSGGEAAKIEKAKKIIQNAIIGLIIVLSSWAITRYVIDNLLVSTGGGGGIQGSGTAGGGGFGGGAGAQSFRVLSFTPSGNVSIRNVQVKIVFSKSVDPKSVSAILVSKVGGTTVGGSVTVEGSVVTFTPADACPQPNADKKCFEGDADYTVKVGGSVKSTQGQTVVCNAFGFLCDGKFHTGNLVDTQPPSVSVSFPTDGMKVSQNFLQDVQADASDDSGVATVQFFEGQNSIGIDAPIGDTPLQFPAKISWDTAGAVLGPHTLTATAADIDTNIGTSSGVSVVVRPDHCFNTKQDVDKGESGIDCGGDSNSQDYCGACAGGVCSKNADCSSGFCLNGICVEKPVIQSVGPLNGKAGTFVTLKGVNFGGTPGKVVFLGGPGASDDKEAVAPQVCVDAGLQTWSSSQVVIAVPVGAASGPMQIQNSGSLLIDATNDSSGPQIPNFVVDNAVHPGVCGAVPDSGSPGNQTDLIGQGFGVTAKTVLFGKTVLSPPQGKWTDGKLTFTVPVVNSAPYQVSVSTDGGVSNPVNYTVVDKNLGAAPVLQMIDPPAGAQQAYITLQGQNFGYSVGQVVFTGGLDGNANGDTSFPPQCTDAFWTDQTIVIKVPTSFINKNPIQDGAYQVKVRRQDSKESNSLEFNVDSKLPIGPGICAVTPSIGPAGTAVSIIGDKLGANGPESITFSAQQLAKIEKDSGNQLVHTLVPSKAVTGPMSLKVNGQESNKVLFQVRNCNEAPEMCGQKSICCPTGECAQNGQTCGVKSDTAEYAWKTSTGLIPIAPRVIEECTPNVPKAPVPSPTPWLGRPGGDQTPVDASVVMRFSKMLKPSTTTNSAFHVLKCTAKDADPCKTTEEVKFDMMVGSAMNKSQQVITLQRNPVGKMFDVNTTYLVTVATSIMSDGPGGALMDEMKSCGLGPKKETLGYCFRFKTRNSPDPSAVGLINVIPDPFYMHGKDTENYNAVPISAGDACIVLDCRQFDWQWNAGDGRASISKDTENGLGKCEQIATGVSETNDVPVEITAGINANPVKPGVADLYVNFVPPTVEAYGPDCGQACVNALVWARFSEKLDLASVTKLGNVVIQPCANENCNEAELLAPLALGAEDVQLISPYGSLVPDPRMIVVKPVVKKDGKSTLLLAPGTFYRVLLRGGKADGIKGLNSVPMTGLNHADGFQWTFRVKLLKEGAMCQADKIDVTPPEKYEGIIGARQEFVATPFGKPDECNASGQPLIQTTSAVWKTETAKVADYFKLSQALKLVDTGGTPFIGCNGKCLATGSIGQYGKVSVCGNGIIETTDTNYCDVKKNSTTPAGDTCQVLPAGADAGEECEPGLGNSGGLCDSNTCLWLPVKTINAGGTCGDGKVSGTDACDFGPTCVGGSVATSTPPIPELTPCSDPAVKTACEKIPGASCGMHDYRGCSSSCRHLGAFAGKTTCGNSDIKGDGKDCDDGNATDGDGCSSSCLHEPSTPKAQAFAVCGNGIPEPGEVCEAIAPPQIGQSPVFPPGCDTLTCLHTGTAPMQLGDKVGCGNAMIDAGEDCDDGNIQSGDGCSAKCLLEGSSSNYTADALTPSFCSNGLLELGEQCEATISSDKLSQEVSYGKKDLKGIALSEAYSKISKTQKGDGLDDASQLGVIIGDGTPDADGKMSSKLTVDVEGKTGSAVYGLQCGFTSEDSCTKIQPNSGLDANSCCSVRPSVEGKFPQQGAQGVCRNVQIQAAFNVPMDTTSVLNNLQISEATSTVDCKDLGQQEVVVDAGERAPGLWNWFKHVWSRAIAWFKGDTALAVKYCTGGVTGQLVPVSVDGQNGSQKFNFVLDHSLRPQTTYLVRFMGDSSTKDPKDGLSDNDDPKLRLGVKTAKGVVHPYQLASTLGELAWTFKTGNDICSVNVVTVLDSTPAPAFPKVAHPYLFVNENGIEEKRNFQAQAQSIQNGIAIPLSPLDKEYSWTWLAWTSSNQKVVTVTPSDGGKLAKSSSVATALKQNGSSVLTAGLKVDIDTVSNSSTIGTVIKGIAPVTVSICENPWPQMATAPFRDTENSPSVVDLESNPLLVQPDKFGPNPYHFSTMYCRDAGKAQDQKDDLPALKINLVPPNPPVDDPKGILRQYFFSYRDDAPTLQQDGIGIRIIANPQHLSPLSWYKSNGFKGSPQLISVDGYPALKDGGTIYVAASNRKEAKGGSIYSNIYLISHNPDAKPETLNIYNQMVQYLTFNINLIAQGNVCVLNDNTPFPETSPVSCSADWECFGYGRTDVHCDSLKLKLARDTTRMADFQEFVETLEASKNTVGSYPKATGGTYLRGMSTSRWTSWANEIGATVGKTIPVDPVNHFLTCGRCSISKLPCQGASECPVQIGADGKKTTQTCVAGLPDSDPKNPEGWKDDPNIDPATCWNQSEHKFYCPSYGGEGVSRLYQYQTIADASSYKLSAEFEVLPPDLANPQNNWWSPPLQTSVYQCVGGAREGILCTSADGKSGKDALCRSCMSDPSQCKTCHTTNKQIGLKTEGQACTQISDCIDKISADVVCKDFGLTDNSVPSTAVTVGSCRQIRATYSFGGLCKNNAFGDTGSCGDGVLNAAVEKCEKGDTQQVACQAADQNGKPVSGHKLQQCDLKDCQKFIDDPKHPQCVPDAICGNGRIDKTCGGIPNGGGCLTNLDCPDNNPVCKTAESCDDGPLNGTYGHCAGGANGCQNFYGYCGDGQLSPGETCDLGSDNGKWSGGYNATTCSIDCKGVGPFCGDKQINGSEQCDGETLTTTDAICSTSQQPCKTQADCANGETCGGGNSDGPKHNVWDSCVGYQVVSDILKDGILRDTQHRRTCNSPGMQMIPGKKACDLAASWSPCQPIGMCGDGIKDSNEECDDGGNNGPTRSCLNTCKKNTCGDGFVNTDGQIEECDKGGQNGSITCVADYNSMCLSCTKSCKFQATSGGYCGNKIKDGPEQCDGDAKGAPTCKALGYDYGLASVWNEVKKTYSDQEVANPICAPSCNYGGCYRCQDVPGTGKIEGHVHDGVYTNQPVPGARISLMYKGVKTDEAFADGNGYFVFKTLNNHKACDAYRIIVDYYQDNVCTNASDRPSCNGRSWSGDSINESINGGYWPYISDTFQGNEDVFKTEGIHDPEGGVVYLLPKVASGETLVNVRWTGNLKKQAGIDDTVDIDAHLLLPIGYAYTHDDGISATYNACLPNDPKKCKRDLQWYDPGKSNLDAPPNASLYCFHEGQDDQDCIGFDTSPEVLKYKWSLAGSDQFNFFLSDYASIWQTAKKNYTSPLQLYVEVVTPNGVTKMVPPKDAWGKILFVYSQDGSGQIVQQLKWMTEAQLYASFGKNFIGISP